MNPVTYMLFLDDLNRSNALFAWVNDAHDGATVTFSLPRPIWEQIGRPASLTIEVTG